MFFNTFLGWSLVLLMLTWTTSSQKYALDKSVTLFAADIYKHSSKESSANLLLCPLSVQMTLSLMMAGAEGRTLQEMAVALSLPKDKRAVRNFFSGLTAELNATHTELLIANKLYARKNFRVSPEFRDIATDFNADVDTTDFTRSNYAAKKINEWVSLRTKNRISNIVSPSDLNLNTQMVLVNALYFNGKWSKAFDPRNTSPEYFYSTNGPQAVPMMHNKFKIRYADIGELGCTLAEIPYRGQEFAMYIALPKWQDGLKDLENQINMLLETARNELYTAEVNMTLPKFTMEDKTLYNSILQKLDMREAFGDRADFRLIGAQRERLSISKVVSKTFMEVSEEGTVAAAASAVGAVTLSIPAPIPKVTMVVDHPFIFFIAHRKSGAPIFIGRVVDLSHIAVIPQAGYEPVQTQQPARQRPQAIYEERPQVQPERQPSLAPVRQPVRQQNHEQQQNYAQPQIVYEDSQSYQQPNLPQVQPGRQPVRQSVRQPIRQQNHQSQQNFAQPQQVYEDPQSYQQPNLPQVQPGRQPSRQTSYEQQNIAQPFANQQTVSEYRENQPNYEQQEYQQPGRRQIQVQQQSRRPEKYSFSFKK